MKCHNCHSQLNSRITDILRLDNNLHCRCGLTYSHLPMKVFCIVLLCIYPFLPIFLPSDIAQEFLTAHYLFSYLANSFIFIVLFFLVLFILSKIPQWQTITTASENIIKTNSPHRVIFLLMFIVTILHSYNQTRNLQYSKADIAQPTVGELKTIKGEIENFNCINSNVHTDIVNFQLNTSAKPIAAPGIGVNCAQWEQLVTQNLNQTVTILAIEKPRQLIAHQIQSQKSTLGSNYNTNRFSVSLYQLNLIILFVWLLFIETLIVLAKALKSESN